MRRLLAPVKRYLLSAVSATLFDAIRAHNFDKSTLGAYRLFQRQQYALRFPLYPLLITSSTQLDRKTSRHDLTIVDWDLEYQHKLIPVNPKVQCQCLPLKRQSGLQQTTNLVTPFLIFERNKE